MTSKLQGLYAPDQSTYVTITDGEGNVVSDSGGDYSLTDRSGTITSGGTAQSLAAANSSRHGFWIQNNSTGDIWISPNTTAVASEPSLWLPSGAYYEFPSNGVPSTAISIYGATTGQTFTAREW